MDHEVEHHSDVGTARVEGRQPLALHEAWGIEIRHRRAHRPIEALHMTHLHEGALVGREAHDRVRLLDRRRDRLLDEEMDAALQGVHRHVMVRLRGHHDHRGVHLVEQRRHRRERRHTELLRDLRGALGARVVESDERGTGLRAKQTHVMEAERAGSHDADANCRHAERAATEASAVIRVDTSRGSE